MSPKVQKIFSVFGIMNSPWTPFGRKTLYKDPKEQKERWQKGLDDFQKDPYMFKQQERYEQERWEELKMSFFRKFKFEENLLKYLKPKSIQVEKILSETEQETETDDIIMRTSKYSVLQKIYD